MSNYSSVVLIIRERISVITECRVILLYQNILHIKNNVCINQIWHISRARDSKMKLYNMAEFRTLPKIVSVGRFWLLGGGGGGGGGVAKFGI